jgi:hypothetical protein
MDRKCPGLVYSRRLMDSCSGHADCGRAGVGCRGRPRRCVHGNYFGGAWWRVSDDRSWCLVGRCSPFREEVYRWLKLIRREHSTLPPKVGKMTTPWNEEGSLYRGLSALLRGMHSDSRSLMQLHKRLHQAASDAPVPMGRAPYSSTGGHYARFKSNQSFRASHATEI